MIEGPDEWTAGDAVSPEAKAVEDTDVGGFVGKVAGSWIFPTIHF